MQFFKRHFEKIIFSAVLAGLRAAAFCLYMKVEEVKKEPTSFAAPATARGVPGVETNLAPLRVALTNLTNAPGLELTGAHNLFNPVRWVMMRDGTLVKMTKAGVDALEVTDIRPLCLTITLQSQVSDGFYLIYQPPPPAPKRTPVFAKIGDKPTALRPYTIVSNNAEAGKGVVLQLLLNDGDTVSVSTNEPFKRVERYEADLKYSGSDSTNNFTKKHVEDTLAFSGEIFKIIAIASNNITVQDTRTAQKTEKEWKGGQ